MADALKAALITIPVLIATALAVLLSPEAPGGAARLDCVTGEAALNPTQISPSGDSITLPTNQRFATVAEAERWICLDVKQAELLPGWRVTEVIGHRSNSLDMFTRGRGYRAIEIFYENTDLDMGIADLNTRVILQAPGDANISAGASEPFEIQGVIGTLWLHGEDPFFTLQWGKGEDAVIARGGLLNGVELERDILPLLETVR